jgi:hypothetical protein
MAEGDLTVYPSFYRALAEGQVNLTSSDTVTLKVILLTSDYTPNWDTDMLYGDISANEYGSSDNYTAGGATLESLTWTYSSDNIRSTLDAANVTWSSLGPLETATPGYGVIYVDGAAASDDHLAAAIELGATATNGGDYTLAWAGTGIITSS